MTPEGDEKRRSNLLAVGAIAVLLTVFSTVIALVSVALYRVEREAMDGKTRAGRLIDSSDRET